jgi:hypothetical protein
MNNGSDVNLRDCLRRVGIHSRTRLECIKKYCYNVMFILVIYSDKVQKIYIHTVYIYETPTEESREVLSWLYVIVPDRRCRILLKVVLVRALGNLGSGNLEGGWLGRERSVYKQPETEVDRSCHS